MLCSPGQPPRPGQRPSRSRLGRYTHRGAGRLRAGRHGRDAATRWEHQGHRSRKSIGFSPELPSERLCGHPGSAPGKPTWAPGLWSRSVRGLALQPAALGPAATGSSRESGEWRPASPSGLSGAACGCAGVTTLHVAGGSQEEACGRALGWPCLSASGTCWERPGTQGLMIQFGKKL